MKRWYFISGVENYQGGKVPHYHVLKEIALIEESS